MKKRIGIFCLIFVAVLVLTIVVLDITDIVDIHIQDDNGMNCTSLVFLKNRELAGVDRIVITTICGKYKSLTITDEDIIRQVVKETALATHVDIAVYEEVEIKLYDGDRLVRTMTGSLQNVFITVYQEDSYHWIITPFPQHSPDGMVCISNELRKTLLALWQENLS